MSPLPRKQRSDVPFIKRPGSALVIGLLADKWTIPVIHSLSRGTQRTGELKKALPGVSQKMLTQTLRGLEDHGLIDRTVFPEVPPRVEYRLTTLGESINEPLARLCQWTTRNAEALTRALVKTRARRLSGTAV